MDHSDNSAVTAFVAVGSNIDPQSNIPAALELLKQHVHITGSSTFYRTEPVGSADQPSFVNGVWRVETCLGPRQIRLQVLSRVERRLGRVRTEDKFAPRTIDLDLTLYECLQCDEPDLVLPHPDVSRPFVHVPLMELLEGLPDSLRDRLCRLILPVVRQSGSMCEAGRPLPALTARLRQMLANPADQAQV